MLRELNANGQPLTAVRLVKLVRVLRTWFAIVRAASGDQMQIESVELTNFRSFKKLSLALDGKSIYLVSENGGGKTSVLTAIARALGKERIATPQDFGDINLPLEVVVKLRGFLPADQGVFPKELSFVGTPSLRIGFRAVWNKSEQEAEMTCGFPDHGWRQASKQQREALRVVWLPAHRDSGRLLDLGAARALWAPLFAGLNLGNALKTAGEEIAAALQKFVAEPNLDQLLKKLGAELAKVIPDVDAKAFSLGHPGTSSDKDLLREFELLMSHGGTSVPVQRQSAGLIQLAIFIFALKTLENDPRAILLLDEPEISLHPQAQRALATTCRALCNQSIIATHSSNILDRADLRRVVRLSGPKFNVTASQATTLSDPEAIRLSRFVNPMTAEACFARKVVLVEGYSDRVVLLHLALRCGRNLDGEGVSIVAMDGGSGLGTYLRLYGAAGLKLAVLGLCDEDKEAKWLTELQGAGFAVADRASMKNVGFVVCQRDLEEEFVLALGVPATEAVITKEGKDSMLSTFRKQATYSALPPDQQLRHFLHKDNTQWAVPLVDALDLKNIPVALNAILAKL